MKKAFYTWVIFAIFTMTFFYLEGCKPKEVIITNYDTIKEYITVKEELRDTIIKIDADRPYVEITSPANEEQLEIPFWVRANPSDNVGIERVEFDIEPFGEREGLPLKDYDPPYEWFWNDKIYGFHMIKAIAYDNDNNFIGQKIETIINI